MFSLYTDRKVLLDIVNLDWIDTVQVERRHEFSKNEDAEIVESNWESIEIWTKKVTSLEELKEVEEKALQRFGTGKYRLNQVNRCFIMELKYPIWIRREFVSREVDASEIQYWMEKMEG